VSQADPAPRASLAGSTAVMAVGTFASRLLGFVRAATLTSAIGVATASADAFDVANRIPDFFYAVLAGGVLNAILVPQIVRAYARDDGERFVGKLLTIGVTVIAAVTALLTASAALLIALYTRGWTAEQKALAVAFAVWCIPQLFFYGLYTLLGQLLNARGSFGPYMWAPVVNNVIQIAGFGVFIVMYGRNHEVGTWQPGQVGLLAGTTALGVAAQALILLVPLRRIGFRFRPSWSLRDSGLGSAARVALWTLGALLVDQVAVWMAYKLASGAPEAAGGTGPGNAVLTYALAIYVIPHSLVTVSLTTALFTRMSEAASLGDVDGVRSDLSFGMRTTSAFTLFATAALIVLALPLARLLFPATEFWQVQAVAEALVPLSLGLVPLGMTLLIKRVFFAFEDGRTVFAFQIPMAVVFMGVSLVAVRILPPTWWVVGICLAQTLSYVAGVVLRLQSLRARLGGIDGRRLASMHARAGLAAIVSGEMGWMALRLVPGAGQSVGWSAVALAGIGCLMAALYLTLLWVLRVRELSQFLAPLLARVPGRRGGAA
jgi:putative peptidoglycan lipid II flippase